MNNHQQSGGSPNDPPEIENLPSNVNRRSFLKTAGFVFAGAAVAGCEQSRIEKAIPFLIRPEEIVPGKAYWYASTCEGCKAGCGLLVKNRDGRPIKLEGNPDQPISHGGLCVVGQASLLGLYDSLRLKQPLSSAKVTTWEQVDGEIIAKLKDIQDRRGTVRFLTGTVTSATTRRMISRFLSRFADGKHIVYDPLSCSAILEAHERTHGVRLLPTYHFEKAEVIVSVDADFLGTWISPVEYTRGYTSGRSLDLKRGRFSFHWQCEPRFSITGAKADIRHVASPRDFVSILAHLAKAVESRANKPSIIHFEGSAPVNNSIIVDLADRLWKARGRSLVLCGSNNVDQQILVNYINELLSNYGSTVDIDSPSFQRQGNDKELTALIDEIETGTIDALFIHGVNPLYDLPNGSALVDRIKNIPLVVSTADRVDETATAAHFVCPDHHYLESWNDAEPREGVVTITQPVIAPLGGTRSLIESIAVWTENPLSALDVIRDEWRKTYFPRQNTYKDFQSFWDRSVHDGFSTLSSPRKSAKRFALRSLQITPPSINDGEYILAAYAKVSMLDGRHAHNAWLQEVPDPISKITWDNYAVVSSVLADRLEVTDGDVVRISSSNAGGHALELPVAVQPGQQDTVISVALGYGRKGTERFSDIGPQWFESVTTVDPTKFVGTNVLNLLSLKERGLEYWTAGIQITKTGRKHPLATTQPYASIDVPEDLSTGGDRRRPLIQQTTLAAFTTNPGAGSFQKHDSASMWPEQHQYKDHHWGMVIDLNACTGCTACVVSCQAENNIPVVGKDEVRRNREMHWLRIDRYFMETGDGGIDVAHQPMLCHHCDNAPCETVCPVLATVHSEEGLNQQVYNRCVGTRYCANNCPYKIRRFNWFDYAHEDLMENMVLNPDVTVRSRGVMEKCSFCVQRIQESKIEAKKNGIPLKDGDIKTACQQSCPANAITFGDTNDNESMVSRHINDHRFYGLLTELEIRPSVGYMTLVRNRPDEGGSNHE